MWRVRLFSIISVPAFAVLYSLTTLIVLILLPILLMGMKRTGIIIIKFWAVAMFLVIGRRLHITGLNNVSKDGKYILLANHSSLFDIVAILSFFPGLSWFGHERLTRIPIFKRVLRMINYVPMKKASFKSTKEMINQLIDKSRGHTIGIFPEGTRSLNGKINEFYRGFIVLLKSADIDVLPVTLNGFYQLKPKNRFYIGFNSRLEVVIHNPIKRAELLAMSDLEIINTVKGRIESGITA